MAIMMVMAIYQDPPKALAKTKRMLGECQDKNNLSLRKRTSGIKLG